MTLSFTKVYISCLKSCILLLAWYLVFFTSKHFYKIFPKSGTCCFSVSDKTGRPAWSTGACTRTCTLVHVCRPTAGSTDWMQSALGFSGSTARSTARRTLCFFLEDGRPSGRPESNGSLPAGLAADRTGRPSSLQKSNGSFLFCVFLKSVFIICFGRLFLSCWRSFSGQISLK